MYEKELLGVGVSENPGKKKKVSKDGFDNLVKFLDRLVNVISDQIYPGDIIYLNIISLVIKLKCKNLKRGFI